MIRIDTLRLAATLATATFAAAATLAACGDDGAATPGPDADVSSLTYAPCAQATRVGGFEINLTADYTGAQGQVFSGVVPGNVLQVVETEGDCSLVRAPVLSCEPACLGGQTCGTDGTCVPYPTGQDVGTVTVTGLATALSMTPNASTGFYTNPGSLPHPGFAPGAAIALSASGGEVEAFDLLGWGVSPLELAATQVTVESGAPVALTWTPPPAAGPTGVHISLVVNGHGLVGSHIECEVADTGSFTIPAGLVTALVEDGLSGFPTLSLTRRSADSVTLAPGCVDFVVQSSKVLEVVVPGVISCNLDEDCPEGQTCQGDLTCG